MEQREKPALPQARYERMRRLLRVVNRRRRRLRDKVDLLCKDLVRSNQQFTETLHRLWRAYDFQSSLTGEFDLRYLLYKALRELKSDLPDTNATIYLCSKDEFAAHLGGTWFEQSKDIAEWEEIFRHTLVPLVLARKQAMLVADGNEWNSAAGKYRQHLKDISFIGLPVVFDDEQVGVVIIYRRLGYPFNERDCNKLLPLLKPLGRVVASVYKLQGLIVQN